MKDTLKSDLLQLLSKDLNYKIDTLQSEYKVYMESAANETKSTAGDKHDTSRSMMQLEQEKLSGQLQQFKLQKKTLELIDPWKSLTSVQLGAVVFTNLGNFFLVVSGKPIQIDNSIFNCISIQSPIGKMLQGSGIGTTKVFMGKSYTIQLII